MAERINLLKEVNDAITFEGWTALSWALHHGWVQDYKWLFSQKEGRDVGTPETIDRVIGYRGEDSQLGFSNEPLLARGAQFMFAERCLSSKPKKFRDLMIEGYLLGTDFVSPIPKIPDEDGANQLEGELRRYWANKKGLALPSLVLLGRGIVQAYCSEFGLRKDLEDKFAERVMVLR